MNSSQPFLARERGIIIAADVAAESELRRLSQAAQGIPEVVAIKVGFSLALRFGLAAVVDLVKEVSSLAVIYDHQKAGTDIPEMGPPFAEICRDAGVQGAIFFPQAGPRTLEGFVSAAIAQGVSPIVGLVMTHPAYLQSEGGFVADDAPDTICRLAIQLGVKHFVLPGTKTGFVERFAQGPLRAVQDATIMMPGIGAQGGSIAAAFDAAAPHRRFAIVGSAVYKSADPRSALHAFAQQVRS